MADVTRPARTPGLESGHLRPEHQSANQCLSWACPIGHGDGSRLGQSRKREAGSEISMPVASPHPPGTCHRLPALGSSLSY